MLQEAIMEHDNAAKSKCSHSKQYAAHKLPSGAPKIISGQPSSAVGAQLKGSVRHTANLTQSVLLNLKLERSGATINVTLCGATFCWASCMMVLGMSGHRATKEGV